MAVAKIGNGCLAVSLINKTGADSVLGSVVEASTTTDNAFALTHTGDVEPIGIVAESGVADGSECLVIVAGIAQVLLEDTTAATRGNWVKTGETDAGRADATLGGPPAGGVAQLDDHTQEIGHVLESKGAGTDVLCKIMVHFN